MSEKLDLILARLESIENKIDMFSGSKINVESKVETDEKENVENDLTYSNFFRILNTTPSTFNNYFELLKDSDLRFKFNIEGNTETEKQLKVTLIFLTIRAFIFNNYTVTSSDLIGKLETYNVSPNKLGRALSKYTRFLLQHGNGRGTYYELTHAGKQQGIAYISEILKQDSQQ